MYIEVASNNDVTFVQSKSHKILDYYYYYYYTRITAYFPGQPE